MVYPDNYNEVALLSIKTSTATQNFALITESFEINPGEKKIEGKPTVSGGRIAVWTPEGDTEFTGKIIPVGVGKLGDTSADGFWQLFHPNGVAETFPQSVVNTRNRNTYSVAIMTFTGTAPASAFAATVSQAANRLLLTNAYFNKLSYTFSPSDGWMGDMSITVPAFTKAGVGNITQESTDGTANLAVK